MPIQPNSTKDLLTIVFRIQIQISSLVSKVQFKYYRPALSFCFLFILNKLVHGIFMRLKRQDLMAVKVCHSNSLACVPMWLGLNVSDLQKENEERGSAQHWYSAHMANKHSRGGSRIFLGGGGLVSCSTSRPINHIVCFFLQNTSCIRKPQVISGGVRTPCTLPLDPPLHSNNEMGQGSRYYG